MLVRHPVLVIHFAVSKPWRIVTAATNIVNENGASVIRSYQFGAEVLTGLHFRGPI